MHHPHEGQQKGVDTDKIGAEFPAREGAVRISFGSRYGTKLPKGFSLNSFRIEIDRNEAKDLDIQRSETEGSGYSPDV